jgi:uncharacterized membrane protein
MNHNYITNDTIIVGQNFSKVPKEAACRYSIGTLILLFFVYSMIGGAWEFILRLTINGKIINSGVLHGPWLPIYGICGVVMLVVLKNLGNKPIRTFFSVMGISAVIEYVTSWLLEKLLHTSWWDYSAYTFNLNGRICLEALFLFSLLGCVSIYFIAPGLNRFFQKIPHGIKMTATIILIMGFTIDAIYSLGSPNLGNIY